MNETDKRIRKTKALINKTLFELLDEAGFRKITVKALCEKAVISRKTFYLHYETLDSLYSDAIAQMFPMSTTSFVSNLLDQYAVLGDSPDFRRIYQINEIEGQREIRSHSREVSILMSRKNQEYFLKILSTLLKENVPKTLRYGDDRVANSFIDLKYQIGVDFAVSIIKWSFQNRDIPAEKIVSSVHELSYSTYLSFAQMLTET